MGNASSTFFLPSPRTAFNKVLFWVSKKLDWKDFEISDHTRSVIKTTIAFERANAPATTLRRHLRAKLDRQPNTVGVLWTNANRATTAVTLSIEHL